MKHTGLMLLFSSLFLFYLPGAQAVSTFGAYASGSDLDPVRSSENDGGAGSSSASVSFSTYAAQTTFIPGANYLPTLRAFAVGNNPTSDDDRTQADAAAFQVFTSSVAQTIFLDITFDSIVTDNGPDDRSGALLDVFVYSGPNFEISDTFCNGGERAPDGTYICGTEIATSSRNGLNWSNLFNGGAPGVLTLNDTLTFSVGAGQQFAVYAELGAGGYNGSADAFNTASLQYLALDANSDLDAIRPVVVPVDPPSEIPLPAAVWLFGAGLIGIFGITHKNRKT